MLYAANTAGAVVGCFVTGCVLIYWLGVVETNMLAAIVDLGVGIAALVWDRRSPVVARADSPAETPSPELSGRSSRRPVDRDGLGVLRAGV